MEKRYDLLTCGEVLMRLSPEEGQRLTQARSLRLHIGGAELNVAAGAGQLGLCTGIITCLPDNAMGRLAAREIRFQGVSDEYLAFEQGPQARLGLYYYEGAAAPRKPEVVYDRKNSSATRISPKYFPDKMYGETRCFHTSGITLALGGQSRRAAVSMMRRFREEGTLISFDVNFRGNLWTGEEAKACIEEILPLVDIFFCSEDTARLTFQKKGNLREIMKSFTEEYPISVVASTRRVVHSPKIHSFGSVIYHRKSDGYYEEAPYENIEVTDRIGSGDAYVAGALYGLLTAPSDPGRAVSVGNAVSALKNTVAGDLPCMTLSEIEETIREHRQGGSAPEMKR